MSRERDSQRSKFFAAWSVLNDYSRVITTEEARHMITRAFGSGYLKRRFPEVARPIVITLGGPLTSTANAIALPKSVPITRKEVVYQIARAIFYRRDPQEQWAWYGWQFAAIFLEVTHVVMGSALAEMLRLRYRALRVRSAPKATRTVTPEMLERLARAREKALRARQESSCAHEAR